MTGLDSRSRDLLIRTVIGEASGQPGIGEQAVAEVVLNRMRSGRYGGNSVEDVVLAPSQFEPWQTRSSELLGYNNTDPAYLRAAAAVDRALGVDDPTGGATHFLNPQVVRDRRGGSLPAWARGEGQDIGEHRFFAPEGRVMAQSAKAVTDPDLIRQLEAASAPQPRPVTDPGLIQQLEAAERGSSPDSRIADAFDAADEVSDQRLTGRAGAAWRGAQQGASFGLNDEVTAAQEASGLPGWARRIVPGAAALIGGARTLFDKGASKQYDAALNRERALLNAGRQEHPVSSIAGEAGGALATIPALPIKAAQGAGVAGRALTSMAQGGAYGLGYGFGSGEGGLENRLDNAAITGGIGAVTGGAVSPAMDAVVAGARGTGRVARDIAAPLTRGGRERLAAQQLDEAATDPSAFRGAIASDQMPERVPGSVPTAFQASGDMGIGALERRVATQNPAEFMQRRADQNAARRSAMENIQPGGHPEAVVAALRGRMSEIDDALGRAERQAQSSAYDRAFKLGGEGTPEGYGTTVRGSLDEARRAAKRQERTLWEAVDPDGTLALPAPNIRRAAQEIRRSIPASARPPEGEEAAILSVMGRYGEVMPFSEVTALRSRLSSAMREERFARGESPAYSRLSQMRAAIERDLEEAVAQRAVQEEDAVAAGTMREEDTLVAGLQRLQQQRDAWLSARAANRAAGEDGGADPRAYGGTGQAAVPGIRGTAGPARGGSGAAQGDPRLSGYDGGANFDEAARERLSVATDASRARADTFDSGAHRQILRRPTSKGPYNMPAGAVPARIFLPGNRGFESVQAYRNAVGDGEAMRTLQDYAASQLRRFASATDGTLDPSKVTAWRNRHRDALRAFPDLDRRIADAGKASETFAEVAARRKQATEEYQRGLIGQVLGVEDPADVVRYIGAIFGRRDSVSLMSRLIREAGSSKEAREGIRKAVVDHMMSRLVGNTEAATTGLALLKADAFQTFIRQNAPSLKLVFKDHELSMMRLIADDLQRANRSIAAVKLPGGSNTAQDLAAGGKDSILLRFLREGMRQVPSAAAGGAGFAMMGPITGLAAFSGARVVQAMREAGLRQVDDIVKDALLNPERARLLLSRVPLKADGPAAKALGSSYRRTAAILLGGKAADKATEPAQERRREQQIQTPSPMPTRSPSPSLGGFLSNAGAAR